MAKRVTGAATKDVECGEIAERLRKHARTRWPICTEVVVKASRGAFYLAARVDGHEDPIEMCRVRELGSADLWEFGFFSAAGERYELNILPSGSPYGTLEECFDCAAIVHLSNVPTMDFATYLKMQRRAGRRKSSGKGGR